MALENKICQLNVFVDKGEEEQEFLKYMSSSKSVRWTSWFTDIIAKDGGKDVGIKKLAAYYGIDIKETMAFGDGGNDMDMLKSVALGVAMGNARDDVKKVADYITDTVDNDGIEKALKYFKII
nr:HAD hydrolase family protein [Gemella sp. zg-570]